jgi:CubicO group peptidase (beta-lactamase class C family)
MLTSPVTRRLLLVVMALMVPVAAAQDASPITAGQVVQGTLVDTTARSFTIELDEDSFVVGAADQLSVDVVVQIFGPDDKLLGRFDGPGEGPEPFQFETKVAGLHRIEIAPFEGDSGEFTLTITRVEPIATDPEERVDQLMVGFDGPDVPGGAIGIVRDGKVIFAKAYGMANLTYDIPYTIETTSNIGSTSKQFTAFAIGLLANESKLSLDDDIRSYIPELPDLGHVVTIRNLLTHTSGYREFLNEIALSGRQLDKGDYIDRSEVVDMISRQPELQSEPGTEWNYNNSGYVLMTLVVENVTGEPFDQWMGENVFSPLGMTQTRVRANRFDVVPGRASGYAAAGGVYRETSDFAGAIGASSIYTNVGDLALWLNNMHTGELGGTALIEEMTTPYVLKDGEATTYGLGLMITEQRGLTVFTHGGADVSHRSMLSYFPTINAGVIVHSNNATFPAGPFAAKVAVAFFGDEMDDPDDAAEKDASSESSDADDAFDASAYDVEAFEPLAGRYALEEAPAFILTFFVEDGIIYTQATGQNRVEITPTSKTTFELTIVEADIVFHLEDDGSCNSLTLNQGGPHKANRVEDEPWKPSEEQIAAYSGRYFSEELETFYTIDFEDGKLNVRHRRFEMTLAPRDEHNFGGGFPIVDLEFDVEEDGTVTGLTVGNGRTRDIRFDKISNQFQAKNDRDRPGDS